MARHLPLHRGDHPLPRIAVQCVPHAHCRRARGTLIVDGATLTGIDVFGDLPSTQGDAPGSITHCLGRYRGTGRANNPRVIQLINNARIEHAITGIRTENGGRIYAHTVDFTTTETTWK
ncbi:MAG: hypothetical protein IPK76_06125 [Lewinellaceae bacterium]|nr:hypothetical protein [Lewinellaceae bacterium]